MIKIREMLISDYEAVIELWSKTESLSLKDADSKQGINSYLVRNKGLIRTQFNRHSNWLQCNAIGGQQWQANDTPLWQDSCPSVNIGLQ